MQPTVVFMESPAGDVKEVSVTDPNKDLVPLSSESRIIPDSTIGLWSVGAGT
jgi:hypothetical protein